MAETLKDVIEQLKIQNTSSKLPVVGEVRNLGTQFTKLNFNLKRFTDSSVQLNSEMIEKNELINAENLSNQNDNAELLNLQLMDIGNVFSTKIDDLKSFLLDGPKVSDDMLNEIKNQSSYMQEVGRMQGDYFSELREQLAINNEPTREEVKEDNSDDKVAKDTLIISKESNSTLNQMMSFFMAESERDKLREQEEKNERKSSKPLSEKTVDPSRLVRGNKGILGILQEFLTTAFLGSKGKALLRSLIPGKFTIGGFGKTLMTGIAGVLFGPELIKVISNAFDGAMKEEGISNMALEGAKTFLKDADTSTLAAVGGVGGLLLGGVPGAITGALLGVSLKAIGSALGGEKTVIDLAEGDVTKLQGLLGGAASGAGIGFMLGGPTIQGRLAGALLGAGVGALAGYLNSKEEMSLTEVITGAIGVGAGIKAAMMLGAKAGMAGGPLGMIAGALIGAALGLAFGALMKPPKNAIEKEMDKVTEELEEAKKLREARTAGKTLTSDQAKKVKNYESGDLQKNLLQQTQDLVFEHEGSSMMRGFERGLALKKLAETGEYTQDEIYEENERMNKRSAINSFKKFNQIFNTNHETIMDLVKAYANTTRINEIELNEDMKIKLPISGNSEGETNMMRSRIEMLGGDINTGVVTIEKGTDLDEAIKSAIGYPAARTLIQDLVTPAKLLMNKLDDQDSNNFNDAGRYVGKMAQGGLLTPDMGPITAIINEDARFSPEGIFNRPQMQYIADLIKPKRTEINLKSDNSFAKNPQIQEKYFAMNAMQSENEARRRDMATPIVMPPSAPNIVDNKNITVQEQFNVTEMLPAPSSHVSFKDNIVY
tara:strand:- start:23155 stop:25635 length:2481 start_codon:yes stop_codon:yes gene_type:complete